MYIYFMSQILGRPESNQEMEWVIEDSLGSWWRPNFEAPQVGMLCSATATYIVLC